MDLNRRIGLCTGGADEAECSERSLIPYINLKLAFLGCPPAKTEADPLFSDMASLLSHQRETERLLADYLCPADQRIQAFLEDYLDCGEDCPRLPGRTFVLDRHGLARALSLPANGDEFVSDILSSYRVRQGVLHNPKSDRRTTEGIFHIAEGGLPIPDDKRAVPRHVFTEMLRRALAAPPDLLRLPFTSGQAEEARCWVSLLLRPVVCPAVQGVVAEKSLEVRFFAPGTLSSNLDFVESIFGNAGDPYLPENDAGLDVEHWSGHTGCVILAPHLVTVAKKEVGLPHWDQATERQRRDGMCWKTEDERYNNGVAFKLTCRDERGVVVTLIADSYFGYCKKEVKTQISYAANLSGLSEEEHAGGTMAFPAYDLGEEFSGGLHVPNLGYTFAEMTLRYGERMEVQPEGYAVDKRFPDILYVPEDTHFDLKAQTVRWPAPEGGEQGIKLLPGKTYVRPSGYKVHMEKVPGTHVWRLVGTVAEGTLCHKPCTVSGGGKSEISKPISDAILQGPVIVTDFQRDFDQVAWILARDYSDRFLDPDRRGSDSRSILNPSRSLGSVIKLLLPASREYTESYNEWLRSIPQYIKELVFVVKRFYKPEWGNNWREHFSVDTINGTPGNELRCDNRKIVAYYLRVGFEADGSWRTFGLRQDFHPAAKLAWEDDISASVVVPREALSNLNPDYDNPAFKFVRNCEYRLFQRPDDAVHKGYDKLTESDFARGGNFFSNYEPLKTPDAREIVEDAIGFDQFTEPMQRLIRQAQGDEGPTYFVSTAHPRLVNGVPTKNPRYLQTRPDLLDPRGVYLAEMGTRLRRRIPLDEPVYNPVNAVLPGQRNNPPEPAQGIRALAVFNPIHYLPLPELFMAFIASITGRSPSTTGFGSEGALTKGPFNALPPILDLNSALVSYLLTGYEGFITAAGYVGPHARVDHDISLLVPEVWCRMSVFERDPDFLMRNGYLEKCEDLVYEGRTVLTSRLGWRITRRFVRTYFGRVFNHPQSVFTEEMLRPEKQDLAVIVDAMDNIVESYRQVAQHYFNDGSIELACPPLRALLHIMRDNHWDGKDLGDPLVRALFTRENLLAGDWYVRRQADARAADVRLWQRHVAYLEGFLAKTSHADEAERLRIADRLAEARRKLEALQ